MIIGNNDNGNKINNNQNQENTILNGQIGPRNENDGSIKYQNPFVENINSMQHSDPTNKTEMRDKSIAMLQDRLVNGTISLDEFNQKVANINKNK